MLSGVIVSNDFNIGIDSQCVVREMHYHRFDMPRDRDVFGYS